MKLRKIYYDAGFERSTLAPPDGVVDSVILGDTPRVTEDFRYRVPLVGLPKQVLPRSVQLAIFPLVGPYSADTPLDQVYDAAARGEGFSASVVPREGIFDLVSPVLPDGRFQAWVIAVE